MKQKSPRTVTIYFGRLNMMGPKLNLNSIYIHINITHTIIISKSNNYYQINTK